jgi:hypothetical protein
MSIPSYVMAGARSEFFKSVRFVIFSVTIKAALRKVWQGEIGTNFVDWAQQSRLIA